ncbi:MAG: S1C family serine protease, partial [bacterium]|nr:S1C family serine protease [bacterium]
MESSKLPRLNFSGIAITVALGALVAVGLYQAQVRGLIPSISGNLLQPKTLEIQTVVQEENAVVSAVEKASPSVVAIGATTRIFNPFDPFSAPRSQIATIGTGFVVSSRGIIVTNKHVVDDSDTRYNIVTKDGKKYEARKVYRDPVLDLA